MHVLHLMQCTNLGGMEQATYRLMSRMREQGGTRFNIATPRPFGAGERILKTFDHQATDHECKGRFGWRSRHALLETVSRRSAGCSLIWVIGICAAGIVNMRMLPNGLFQALSIDGRQHQGAARNKQTGASINQMTRMVAVFDDVGADNIGLCVEAEDVLGEVAKVNVINGEIMGKQIDGSLVVIVARKYRANFLKFLMQKLTLSPPSPVQTARRTLRGASHAFLGKRR